VAGCAAREPVDDVFHHWPIDPWYVGRTVGQLRATSITPPGWGHELDGSEPLDKLTVGRLGGSAADSVPSTDPMVTSR
jgi:hypothetical protein